MIGLFVIVLFGFIFLLHIIVPAIFSKFEKENSNKGKIFGFILIFSIFFGDHIYGIIKTKTSCLISNNETIYNEKLYEEYNDYKKDNDFIEVKMEWEEANHYRKIIAQFEPLGFHPYTYIDKKYKKWIYYSRYEEKNGISKRIEKLANLETKSIFYEKVEVLSGQGGWLCKKLNSITLSYSCPINCK
ncbi:MAG: hypothetical protein BWY78_00566 [Alphaproteobacteria bacterium ADurb.Bin438]|nr:MAG: hypothetical protein BWY78_00566 [Alphaproteobacteria bacterium ADurb.Bin438]